MLAVAAPFVAAAARRPDVPAPAAPVEEPRREVATAFFPLVYSGIPFTDGQHCPDGVPRTALASFGLASPDADALDAASSRTVLADVLVGEDGLARAVRFVRPRLESGFSRTISRTSSVASRLQPDQVKFGVER